MFSRSSKSLAVVGILVISTLWTAQSNAAQTVVPTCNLESITGAKIASKPIILTSNKTRGMMFSGWVAQTGSKAPNPTKVTIGIFSSDGKKSIFEFNSMKLTPRPDVKRVFKNSAIGNVGFNAKSSSVIPSGNYLLRIMSKYGKSNKSLSCGDWQIKVK
jgi:hypothetical protein